jgi:hypothetical protein
MPTLDELKQALDRLLSLSVTARLLQLNSNKPEKAYEAYVLALCMQAVRNQNGTAELVGIKSGLNPQIVVFHASPGSMASDNQDFCYARCYLREKEFEIHLDVEYAGQSGAKHEIDVSLYERASAEIVRKSKRLPRTHKPLVIALECKFYKSTPGVSLARTFVGLISDCTSNKLSGFVSNKSTPDIDKFLSKPNSPQPFTDLVPGNEDAEQRFIRNVEQVLKKWSMSK